MRSTGPIKRPRVTWITASSLCFDLALNFKILPNKRYPKINKCPANGVCEAVLRFTFFNFDIYCKKRKEASLTTATAFFCETVKSRGITGLLLVMNNQIPLL